MANNYDGMWVKWPGIHSIYGDYGQMNTMFGDNGKWKIPGEEDDSNLPYVWSTPTIDEDV